jgi:hypothetical protein
MLTKEASKGQENAVMQPFLDFWADYAKRADDSTREFIKTFHEGTDFNTWQRHWYEAISKSMDAYMRSPSFLKTIKQNSDAAIKMKVQSDDVASEVARNMNLPMASDISGLFERLHSVEEAILARLGSIEERLETIEERTLASQSRALSTEH